MKAPDSVARRFPSESLRIGGLRAPLASSARPAPRATALLWLVIGAMLSAAGLGCDAADEGLEQAELPLEIGAETTLSAEVSPSSSGPSITKEGEFGDYAARPRCEKSFSRPKTQQG